MRDAADLRALADAGAAGALVATALHRGVTARADDRLDVRDERRRHVGAGRLLQPVPAGDPVELQHVVAQQVDARVVGAQRLGGRQAQALLLGAQLGRPARSAPRARFARQPAPTRSIAASTRPPTTNARRSRPAGSASCR